MSEWSITGNTTTTSTTNSIDNVERTGINNNDVKIRPEGHTDDRDDDTNDDTRAPIQIVWNQLVQAGQTQTTTIYETISKILSCRNINSLSMNEPLLPCSSSSNNSTVVVVVDGIIKRICKQLLEQDVAAAAAAVVMTTNNSSDVVNDINSTTTTTTNAATTTTTELCTVIRVLLLASPTIYDTPWKLACRLIQHTTSAAVSSRSTCSRNNGRQNHHHQPLRSRIVTDIQSFLHQVVTSWWDEEKKQSHQQQQQSTTTASPRRRLVRTVQLPSINSNNSIDEALFQETTPKYWILRLLQTIIHPLFQHENIVCSVDDRNIDTADDENNNNNNNQMWTMELELLSTIVTLCHDMVDDNNNDDDELAVHQALDVLFPKQPTTTTSSHETIIHNNNNCKVHPRKILCWVQIATKLYHLLRPDDWDTIYNELVALLLNGTKLPIQQYPTFIEQLFIISVHLQQQQQQHLRRSEEELEEEGEDNIFDDVPVVDMYESAAHSSHRWHELIVQFFLDAHRRIHSNKVNATAIYGQMEQALYACLSSSSSSTSTNMIIRSHQHTLPMLRQWLKCLVAIISDPPLPQQQQQSDSLIPLKHPEPSNKMIVIAQLLIQIWCAAREESVSSLQIVSNIVAYSYNRDCNTRKPTISTKNNRRRPKLASNRLNRSRDEVTPIQVHTECWDYLLQLMVPLDFMSLFNNKRSTNSNFLYHQMVQQHYLPDEHDQQYWNTATYSVVASVEKMFRNVTYSGRGGFADNNGNLDNGINNTAPLSKFTEALSTVGRFVLRSVSGGDYTDQRSCHETFADSDITERVHNWIQCVGDMTTTMPTSQLEGDDMNVLNCIVAVAVLVTTFIEVSTTRTFIAQSILEQVSQCTTTLEERNEIPRMVYTTAIQVILSPSSKEKQGDERQQQCLDRIPNELDILSTLLTQPMPFTCFCDVARAIAPLPSSRTLLFGNNLPNDCTRPEHEAIRCRLYSLMQLLQRSKWSDYDVEAWTIFSDILVENELDLPFTVRLWVLNDLKEGVRNGKFHRDIVVKLTRAVVVRLIHFLVATNSKKEKTRYGKKAKRNEKPDEIVGLFHLVFTLLHCSSTEEKYKTDALNRCLYLLPELIGVQACQRHQNNHLATDIRDDAAPKLSQDAIESNFECVAAFYCLAVAFGLTEERKLLFDGMPMPPLNEVKKVILNEERTELAEYLLPNGVPIWLTTDKPIETSGGQTDEPMACQELSLSIRRTLCNIVSLLALGRHCWLSTDKIYQFNTTSNRLNFQLASLMDMKHQLTDELDDESELKCYQHLETEALARSFVYFCTKIVPTMKDCILNRVNFQETNEMLSATLDFCENLSVRKIRTDVVISMTQYLQCFRNIYTAVVEEESAVQLIAYLENCCSEGKCFIREVSLTVPDDIACFVRRLRSSFFRCLSCRLLHTDANESFCHVTNERGNLDLPDFFPLTYLATYIKGISKDLTRGLIDGKSGGLTHDLYMSMIECIGKCAHLASFSLKSGYSIKTKRLTDLVVALDLASKALDEILCNFAIHQVNAFKKTFMLCTSTLPSVVRLTRHCNFSAIDEHNEESVDVARRFFDQLFCILKRKSEFEHLELKSWEVIAGKDHLGGRQQFCDSDDDLSELSDGFIEVVKCERDHVSMEQSQGVATTILLRTERSWTWSLCCVMEAFEQDWIDSELFMNNSSQFFEETSEGPYFEIRHLELKQSLEAVYHLFLPSTSTALAHESLHSVSPDCALYLPTSAKFKFCSTVDTVVTVLKKSIKILLGLVQSASPVKNKYLDVRSNMEALVCLYSWLDMCRERDDVCSGLQRWRMVEELFPRAQVRDTNGKTVDGPSLLHRLSNLILRSEEVEQLLQKLMHSVCGHKKRKYENQSNHQFVEEVTSLISDVYIDSPDFGALLSRKVSFLEKEHSNVGNDLGLSSKERNFYERKRKQACNIAKLVQKERRRRVVRSRNSVVDTWLQSDRVTGEEESIDDDAYMDLEDFLVDG